jgi:hypothetical protein
VSLRETIFGLDRGNGPPHRFCLYRLPRNTPRGARNDLTCLDDLEVNQFSRRCGANAEDLGGLLECQQVWFRLCRRKRGPFMVATDGCHSHGGPGIPGTSANSQAVEGGSDLFVGEHARHLAHHFDGFEAVHRLCRPGTIFGTRNSECLPPAQ